MTVRLYLETNFLMSYATGRDPQTDQLFLHTPPGIRKVIPSCCLMEALSCLEDERKRHNARLDLYRLQIGKAERNRNSPHARSLVTHFREVLNRSVASIGDFETRLFQILGQFSNRISSQLIETKPWTYKAAFDSNLELDPTDQLSLATISEDARSHPSSKKVFLSENHRYFQPKSDVRQAIHGNNIQYFEHAPKFLKWYEAQAES